jgi:hypothetical protein
MTLTAVLVGIAIGFAGFTFVYAKGGSYLFNGAPALILQWPIRFLDDSNLPLDQLAWKTIFGNTHGKHTRSHRL